MSFCDIRARGGFAKILILRSLSAPVTSGCIVFFLDLLVYFMRILRNSAIGYRPNKVARFLRLVDLALDASFACIAYITYISRENSLNS